MAKSQQTYNKKEKEKKRRKKKQEKQERREQRKLEKAEHGKKTFEEMLSYVDENGNITSTPPDPSKKIKIKAEDIVLGVPVRDNTPVETTRNGLVKFFNHDKGYGFITDLENKDSIFVHINNTSEPIQENDKVIFEIEMGPKGPNAVNVVLEHVA
jgi:cold shock CspA family protein